MPPVVVHPRGPSALSGAPIADLSLAYRPRRPKRNCAPTNCAIPSRRVGRYDGLALKLTLAVFPAEPRRVASPFN